MASYGGLAAAVVNKQESDRDRRLRLRREEFAQRGILAGTPNEKRGEDHVADPAGRRGVASPPRGEQERGGDLAQQEPHEQPQQFAGNDSTANAKRQRYLELRAKLLPEERAALDAQYNVRAYEALQEQVKVAPVLPEELVGTVDAGRKFNAAAPPPRSGRNAERMGELDQLDSLHDKMVAERGGAQAQFAPAPPAEPAHHLHAEPSSRVPLQYPQAPHQPPPQEMHADKLHPRDHPPDMTGQSMHAVPRNPLRPVQPLRDAGASSGGLFGGGLGFGGPPASRKEEEAALRKREYAAFLKQQMQDKGGKAGVGSALKSPAAADDSHLVPQTAQGTQLQIRPLAPGRLYAAEDAVGASRGGVDANDRRAADAEMKRQYAQDLRRQAEEDKRRREEEKKSLADRSAVSGRAGPSASRSAHDAQGPSSSPPSQILLPGWGGRCGVDEKELELDPVVGRRSPGPHHAAAMRDARSIIGAALVVGDGPAEKAKEEAGERKQQYAQELRRQVEEEREKKEQQKREESERERREEEKIRLTLAKEQQMLNVPVDQFGNPLREHAPAPVEFGGHGAGHAEGERGGSMRPQQSWGGDMGAGQPSLLLALQSPVGMAKKGKGGVAARALKEEGMPVVVPHDVYKAAIEEQIAEKKKQQEEQRRREDEEERRDNERLQRQIHEMQQQAERELQRRVQKDEEAEAQRQALLAQQQGTSGGGGQLLSRTPPPSAVGGHGEKGYLAWEGGDRVGARPLRDNDQVGAISGVELGEQPLAPQGQALDDIDREQNQGGPEPISSRAHWNEDRAVVRGGDDERWGQEEGTAEMENAGFLMGGGGKGGRPAPHLYPIQNVGQDPRYIMQLYGAEGSVEQTLAALRADLEREHQRLQQELGVDAALLPEIRSNGYGGNPPSQDVSGGDGQQDAARGGRAWMGAMKESAAARARHFASGGGGGGGGLVQHLLEEDGTSHQRDHEGHRWHGADSLEEVGALAAAKEPVPPCFPEGAVKVAGRVVPNLDPRDAQYLRRLATPEFEGEGLDRSKNPAREWVLNAADLKYLRGDASVDFDIAPAKTFREAAAAARADRPPTRAGTGSRPHTSVSLPPGDTLSPSLALNVQMLGLENRIEHAARNADDMVSGSSRVQIEVGQGADVSGVVAEQGQDRKALFDAKHALQARGDESAAKELCTVGHAGDAGGNEFHVEKGRRRVTLLDEEDHDDTQLSRDIDDSDEPATAGVEESQEGEGDEVSEGRGEELVGVRVPQRCDSPDIIKSRPMSRVAKARPLAEQSLASASALVAPDASLSLFAPGMRPSSRAMAAESGAARRPFAVEEGRGGALEIVAPDASLVRDSASMPIVEKPISLPAGARGLGTPNSMRRAASLAQRMFEDTDDSFDNPAAQHDRVHVDQSLSGASFLVALKKSKEVDRHGAVGVNRDGSRMRFEGAYDAGSMPPSRQGPQGTLAKGRSDSRAQGRLQARAQRRAGERPTSGSKVTSNRLRAAEDGEIDYLLQKFVDSRAA